MTAYEDFFRKLDGSKTLHTTVEFYNSGFGVKRYVTGEQVDKSFTLETDAPRNANTSVVFTAAAFNAPTPDTGEQGDISLDIQIAGAGLQIEEMMRARVQTEPVQVIWRQHLTGETYPIIVLPFEINNVELNDLIATIQAASINTSGLDISERYTTDRFPGLKARL